MPRLASTSRLGSEFDAFLFASIGEDSNGLSLSVLSALARMDLDPWQEAATLATLPPAAAVQKVAALFRALPDEALSERDRDMTATRLIALLPRQANPEIKSPLAYVSIGSAIRSRLGVRGLFFVVMLVLLLAQLVMARHYSPVPGDASEPAPSQAGPPQASPLTSE